MHGCAPHAAANPAEYLLSSLVGCIQVTLHVIAGEAGVKLSKVEWHADGDIDLRGFLGVPVRDHTLSVDLIKITRTAAGVDH